MITQDGEEIINQAKLEAARDSSEEESEAEDEDAEDGALAVGKKG